MNKQDHPKRVPEGDRELWVYQCCRSTHKLEITWRGPILWIRDTKVTHHGNTTTRVERVGPSQRENRDVVTWWHGRTCPNSVWCEFDRQAKYTPRVAA